MRKSVHEKFKNKINFVRPLYRTSNNNEHLSKRNIPLEFDRVKLGGHDNQRITEYDLNLINTRYNTEYKVILPGQCESEVNIRNTLRKEKNNEIKNAINGSSIRTYKFKRDCDKIKRKGRFKERKMNVSDSTTNIIIHKMPEKWLRVYPAPRSDKESTCSVIVRCVVCQLGLTSFLILWTIIGVFVIQFFEGPHETHVSILFEKEQNQLVIDLATELRQITPLSPKWKHAIEKRIEDERRITLEAVARGVKMKPGQFWTLSGTFLFGVYVMTALGFGVPVPHTVWGRISALIYAILAVPTHIYLMVNASSCLVANVDMMMQSWKERLGERTFFSKTDVEYINESPDCSRNSEAWKRSRKSICRKITGCISIFCVGYGLPLVITLYYVIGVVGFGVLRSKSALESAMFPLEFTTTGGLDQVENYARILYGLYVEGAMCILACLLATIRRYSSRAVTCLTDNYRLFHIDKCSKCSD